MSPMKCRPISIKREEGTRVSVLNNLAYTVEKDRLVYDAKHPIDATAVEVMVESGADGILKRGQLLDFGDNAYSIHSDGGVPSAIVARDAAYTSDDTEVVVAVYTSGTFRASEVIAEPEISMTDIEGLRSKGIYLK